MNFQAHGKCFSHIELPNHSYPALQQGPRSTLNKANFGLSSATSPQNIQQKRTITNFNHNPTNLHPFRNKRLQGDSRYQEAQTPQKYKAFRDLSAITVDNFCNEGNNCNTKGFFNVPYAIKIQKDKKDIQVVHNFIYSTKHRDNTHSFQRSGSNSQQKSSQFNDEEFRKSNSMMFIRKLQKKRQKLAQNQRVKLRRQLGKKREIPIHHTHFYFSKGNKIKTEGCSPAEVRVANHRTNRAIKQILQLHETLKQEQGKSSYRTSNEEKTSFPKRFSCDITVHQLTASKEAKLQLIRRHRKKISLEKAQVRKIKETRQEQFDFGPWNRKITGDFDDFI